VGTSFDKRFYFHPHNGSISGTGAFPMEFLHLFKKNQPHPVSVYFTLCSKKNLQTGLFCAKVGEAYVRPI